MFEFLSNANANDALAGLHFALRRITHRQLSAAPSVSSQNALTLDHLSVDTELGLKLIREIERAEQRPLTSLSPDKAHYYKEELVTLAQNITKQTFKYDKKVGLSLLKEWREEPLTNVSTMFLPTPLPPVPLTEVWGLGVYLIFLVIGLTYFIYALWPGAAWDSEISLFLGSVRKAIPPETRLLLLAMLIGALGSCIQVIRSFTWYIGNRKLSGNSFWSFLLQPFMGMALSLVFYFVIRGGFLSATARVQDMNIFGIAALSGLTGMFSQQAAEKLAEVFRIVFARETDSKLVAIEPTPKNSVNPTPR